MKNIKRKFGKLGALLLLGTVGFTGCEIKEPASKKDYMNTTHPVKVEHYLLYDNDLNGNIDAIRSGDHHMYVDTTVNRNKKLYKMSSYGQMTPELIETATQARRSVRAFEWALKDAAYKAQEEKKKENEEK